MQRGRSRCACVRVCVCVCMQLDLKCVCRCKMLQSCIIVRQMHCVPGDEGRVHMLQCVTCMQLEQGWLKAGIFGPLAPANSGYSNQLQRKLKNIGRFFLLPLYFCTCGGRGWLF